MRDPGNVAGTLLDPDAGVEPERLGQLLENHMDRERRRSIGAFYTPPSLAAEVAESTLDPLLASGADPSAIRVCDPAVGGGALLLAAARLLIGRGGEPAAVVGNMAGIDIDPAAAGVARRALGLLGGVAAVAVGDALSITTSAGFDAVLTNPPFLGQLKRGTVRTRAQAAARVARFGAAAGGYTDDAALFLMLSLELVRDGGRVGIILPEPVVATRDGAPARRYVGARSREVRSWKAPPEAFDAGIRTRVVVFERTSSGDPESAWAAGRWSSGGRAPKLEGRGRVADVASTTAGFRDEFYGLAAAAVDGSGDELPALLTCGLIEPAWSAWGQRPARVGGRCLQHPCVDLDTAGAAEVWARRLLVPKVLVATQTRVLEAVADEAGRLVPGVPVIAVVPRDEDVWHLLAVLLAPAVSSLALWAHGGAALSADAIKLSARQVGQLPLPVDRGPWDAGAAAARAATDAGRSGDHAGWRAALAELGAAMGAAYRADPAVLEWWGGHIDRVASRLL